MHAVNHLYNKIKNSMHVVSYIYFINSKFLKIRLLAR